VKLEYFFTTPRTVRCENNQKIVVISKRPWSTDYRGCLCFVVFSGEFCWNSSAHAFRNLGYCQTGLHVPKLHYSLHFIIFGVKNAEVFQSLYTDTLKIYSQNKLWKW